MRPDLVLVPLVVVLLQLDDVGHATGEEQFVRARGLRTEHVPGIYIEFQSSERKKSSQESRRTRLLYLLNGSKQGHEKSRFYSFISHEREHFSLT